MTESGQVCNVKSSPSQTLIVCIYQLATGRIATLFAYFSHVMLDVGAHLIPCHAWWHVHYSSFDQWTLIFKPALDFLLKHPILLENVGW